MGRRLLAFAERFRGPEGTSVIVADNDARSRRFFERNGYTEAARRPRAKDGWPTPGAEWILMRKGEKRGQWPRSWLWVHRRGFYTRCSLHALDCGKGPDVCAGNSLCDTTGSQSTPPTVPIGALSAVIGGGWMA